MKYLYLGLIWLGWWGGCLSLPVVGQEPAAGRVREWTSTAGTKITACAVSVKGGMVRLEVEQEGGKRPVQVPVEKLVESDQALLRKQFGDKVVDGIPVLEALAPDDTILLPKGKVHGPIKAGPNSSYYLYLPKSLPKGRKHPLMMVLNPHHGGANTLQRYQNGAERNGWILITSVESANEVEGKVAMDAILQAVDHAKATLPVDAERIFTGGYSGGAWKSFEMVPEVNAAGVLACGMGASIIQKGIKRTLPIYILAGSNCYNRMAPGITVGRFTPKSKDSLARYFKGNHDWAPPEIMEDGITHLHEAVLAQRRGKYQDEAYRNEVAILNWAYDLKERNPARALMWTTFLRERPVDTRLVSAVEKLHTELSRNRAAVRWVECLRSIHEVVVERFGKIDHPTWGLCLKDIRKLSQDYADTSWKETLDRMLLPDCREGK